MSEIVTEVVPRSGEGTDAATPAGREWLRARYARRDSAYVRLNMITSLTGAAAGADGTSESLTNRVDRTILGLIRQDADVVVVGAQSVRAEGYIMPRRSRLAVVTASGDLSGHRLEPRENGLGPLVLVPAERAASVTLAGAEVVAVPGPERMTPAAILAVLAERGLTRVVCEGGPSLASQFAASGLIDEYCISVAPTLEPAATPFIGIRAEDRPRTAVTGMLVDEAGFSYLRLRSAQGRGPAASG